MKKHKKIISLFLSSALAFICTGNTAGAAVNLSTENGTDELHVLSKVIDSNNNGLLRYSYIDEDGNNSMSLIYTENDILLKFKMENDLLITEWGKLRPVISENEPPGFYFVRRSE